MYRDAVIFPIVLYARVVSNVNKESTINKRRPLIYVTATRAPISGDRGVTSRVGHVGLLYTLPVTVVPHWRDNGKRGYA